jgi:hypothetical protein
MSPVGPVHDDAADGDGDALLDDERSPAFAKGPGASRRHSQESERSRVGAASAAAVWPGPETTVGAETQHGRSPSPARSDVSGVEAFQDWGSSDDDNDDIDGARARAAQSMAIEGQPGTVRTPSPRECSLITAHTPTPRWPVL